MEIHEDMELEVEKSQSSIVVLPNGENQLTQGASYKEQNKLGQSVGDDSEGDYHQTEYRSFYNTSYNESIQNEGKTSEHAIILVDENGPKIQDPDQYRGMDNISASFMETSAYQKFVEDYPQQAKPLQFGSDKFDICKYLEESQKEAFWKSCSDQR